MHLAPSKPKALNGDNFFTNSPRCPPARSNVHAVIEKNKMPSKARFSPPLIDTFKAREIQKKFEMAFLEQNKAQNHMI